MVNVFLTTISGTVTVFTASLQKGDIRLAALHQAIYTFLEWELSVHSIECLSARQSIVSSPFAQSTSAPSTLHVHEDAYTATG